MHMRLGIQDNPVLYTGGINKPATAAPAAQAMDISHVPPEHLEMLRGDPALAPEFDQMYGDGFAAAVLGITPRPVAAVDVQPTDEHLEMLRSDPSLAPKFDKFYGPGSAERFLQGQCTHCCCALTVAVSVAAILAVTVSAAASSAATLTVATSDIA